MSEEIVNSIHDVLVEYDIAIVLATATALLVGLISTIRKMNQRQTGMDAIAKFTKDLLKTVERVIDTGLDFLISHEYAVVVVVFAVIGYRIVVRRLRRQ